jgi:hypothetical protein
MPRKVRIRFSGRKHEENEKRMLWETIDRLKSSRLDERARELRAHLESVNDEALIQFHREAIVVYRALFNESLYRLYSVAFEGETNGSGLSEFCCNVILRGKRFYEAIRSSPDNFGQTKEIGEFNEEHETSVTEVAREILHARNGDDADLMLFRGGARSLSGIWEELESAVGQIDFEIDWMAVEELMPIVYSRFRK